MVIGVVHALLQMLPAADAIARANDGSDAVLFAAKSGHFELLRWLVDDGGLPADTSDDGGARALHWAIIKDGGEGRGEAVVKHLLVAHGQDAAWEDSEGNNAAHYAALCGHLGLLQWLVDTRRADMRVQNHEGLDCAGWARQKGHAAVADWIDLFFAAQDHAQTQVLLAADERESSSFQDLGAFGRTFASLGSSVARLVGTAEEQPSKPRRLSQIV